MQSERASHLGLMKNQLIDKENIPYTEDGTDIIFKSKIPVPVKVRPMPDFNNIHQSFQNKFQKGKAVRKKACTRPCPFNLTKKGERFQLQPVTDVGHQPLPKSDRTLLPSNSCLQGPLVENQQQAKCGATAESFKADPAALASILSNSGLSSKAMGISRAASLVQRVPVRGNRNDRASTYVSCGSSVSRVESVYSSCTSRRMDKALEERLQQPQDLKPAFLSRPLPSLLMGMSSTAQPKPNLEVQSTGAVPETEELCRAGQGGTGERRADMPSGAGHSAEDGTPVIQNALAVGLACPVVPKDFCLLDTVASTQSTCPSVPNSLPCSGTVPSISLVASKNLARPAVASIGPNGVLSKTGEDSKDFVPDLEALASILSNTGITSSGKAAIKKTSMAQRVPVRGRAMTSLYSAANSSSMVKRGSLFGQRMSFDPKMNSGHMSRLEFKEKEMCGTPFRVPKPSTELLPQCSAQRVAIQHPLYPLHTASRRRPIFPKTRDKAKVAETQQTLSQACREWTNVESPLSLDSGRAEEVEDPIGLPMEKIAVQLFPDVGDAAGDLGQEMALPSVETNQDMNKLKRIELLAKLILQEMKGISHPGAGASQDLDTFIKSIKNSPASSDTLSKQKSAVVDHKQCPASSQLNQPMAESGHGTCMVQNRVPSGGLAAGLWDTGGSSTKQSGIPPCRPVPAVASDSFLGVDKNLVHASRRPLCSNFTSQSQGPLLDPGPVPQSLTAISIDRAVPGRRFPTTSQVKQRMYRLATSSRFVDSCLDDECAFYTSRVAKPPQDNRPDSRAHCLNPIAQTLALQEAVCFIPITHGEV
uniref:Tastin isoform X2 n=1 Tax=Geotrypetes seraphini TaxID=260995 RepID=A0A6P8R1B6_GEOSA|nr:tastin isoform X2 [Geotrypetes seraphini]